MLMVQCPVEACAMADDEPFDIDLDQQEQPCWYLRERPLERSDATYEAGCVLMRRIVDGARERHYGPGAADEGSRG